MSDEGGSAHKPVFKGEVNVTKPGAETHSRYVGEGNSKRAAENAAAQKALNDMSPFSRKLERSASKEKRLNVDADEDDFPPAPAAPRQQQAPPLPLGSNGKGDDWEDDWEALADEPAARDIKATKGDAGGKAGTRGRGRGGKGGSGGKGGGTPAGCAQSQPAQGQHSHGVLNLDISAEDLDITPDEAKGVLQKSLGPNAAPLEFRSVHIPTVSLPPSLAQATPPALATLEMPTVSSEPVGGRN